jgi:pyruvate kinase
VALSFVREARDLLQLKELFDPAKPKPLVIAKIEDQSAVTNLESIVQEADGIMIARGDLGIEIPYEDLPIVQRRIVKTCLKVGKPVIVATHMLESMINSPMPTRAEVTDVANAVYEQADAIMLSGETTVGKHPLKCIEVFDRITTRIERGGGANFYNEGDFSLPRQKLVKSAVVMANELKAEAILVITRSGNLARYTSWLRPHSSRIYAVCPSVPVANGLTLSWDVTPFVVEFDHAHPEKTISSAINALVKRKRLKKGSAVVVIAPVTVDDQLVDAVQMRFVK